MAKRTFTTVIDHTSNAGFQAWATELFNEIIAAGLVQSADTGQLATPVVAARPGTNTSAGYWIFEFNDTLQGTAPIFLRIEPGTFSAVAVPRVQVTVGTGSNGSGTITGTILASTTINGTPALISSATPYPSYINHDEGFFGMAWKSGAQAQGLGFLHVCRTTDPDTTPNDDGYAIFYRTSGSQGAAGACGVFAGSPVTNSAKAWCMIPWDITSSTVGSDFQVFKVYGTFPQQLLVPQLVVAIAAELSVGNTTGAVEIVDSVNREFLSTGLVGSSCTINSTGTTYSFAMKWD